jgi:hypothetical protein
VYRKCGLFWHGPLPYQSCQQGGKVIVQLVALLKDHYEKAVNAGIQSMMWSSKAIDLHIHGCVPKLVFITLKHLPVKNLGITWYICNITTN